MDTVIVSTLNGVSYGLIVFLIAAGLTVTMGLMRLLNLAHGAFYALGSYITWNYVTQQGLDLWLAVVASAFTVGVLALLLAWVPLSRLTTTLDGQVLLTLGLTYALTNVMIWVWTAEPKAPLIPASLAGQTHFLVPYPSVRLALIVVAAGLAAAIWWFERHTRIGAKVKAGMDDPAVARALGIDVARIGTIVFAVGAWLAGLSGGLGQTIVGVQPSFAIDMLVTALIVVVIGGPGSVTGALVGALLIGLVQAFGQGLFPEYSAFGVYLVMITMLAVKPEGLFGRSATRAG